MRSLRLRVHLKCKTSRDKAEVVVRGISASKEKLYWDTSKGVWSMTPLLSKLPRYQMQNYFK